MDIVWRPYQERMFLAVAEAIEKGIKRHLIVQATGTGKRIQAVGLSQNYERTLFICHREELIEQAYVDFNEMYPLQVGIVKGPRFEIDNKIVIASARQYIED
jgi:superfamily II DNA or RNA helicase